MTSTVVVGGFFGDEGKGKIISYFQMPVIPLEMVIKCIKLECFQVDF
jgi:adenylosuccinate synthase